MGDEGWAMGPVDFRTTVAQYRHWRVAIDGPVATVTLAVDPHGGLSDGYELKLNSYDLSVDIELYDVVQRLRFEHPEVGAVVLTSGLDRTFCAGANIQMLAGASHDHKVNFCKFTNETRLAIEDAGDASSQRWIAAVNGVAAGGGYELALACHEIALVDDRSSTVSLPEVPLLGVLPGTGGLTRVVDKRHVRRDLADMFTTRAEGVRGEQAAAWELVDSVAAPSEFAAHVRRRAEALAAQSDRPRHAGRSNRDDHTDSQADSRTDDYTTGDTHDCTTSKTNGDTHASTTSKTNGDRGVTLTPLERTISDEALGYPNLTVGIDRQAGTAHFLLYGPGSGEPATPGELLETGDKAWLLAACRELDDSILHLRLNEPEIGTWVMHTRGDPDQVLAADEVLDATGDWLVREVSAYWKRTFKRLDVSARSVITLVEPGSCYAGTLSELVLAADRSYMLEGGSGGSGPEATGPEATGPEATGPEATGPEATGPEATGPEATGPEATRP
ncbi:MAG: enoyl-CoA hydratase-related protein, partial [Acidimicrobiales bacterium]